MLLTVWFVSASVFVSPLAAQYSGRRDATRMDLEIRRDSLAARMVDMRGDELREIERELAAVEQRLRLGDYRPGDVVGLKVRGQPQWTGSFTVQPDQTLLLPGVPPIDLEGTLYSEAPPIIEAGLATVLRDPQVEIDSRMRVAVVGEFKEPGYYDVSGSMLVSDVLMLAGGPTNAAAIEKLKVRRLGETYVDGPVLAAAGLTLDDLGIQPGDAFEMPNKEGKYNLVRNLALAMGALASAIAIIAIVF
jgi:protein involved in polysaccharide export with SLBB domain